MIQEIKAYMEQIEALNVASIKGWDTCQGTTISWIVIGTFHGEHFKGLFVAPGGEYPSLELIQKRVFAAICENKYQESKDKQGD